jgi:hypothetical protein
MEKRGIVLVLLAFILLLAISSFASAGLFNKNRITGHAIAACTDTDGGDNRYVKGSISPPLGSSYQTDRCYLWGTGPVESCTGGNCSMEEYRCVDIDGDGISETYNSAVLYAPCPYGCSNGACLSAPTNTCTDSDGGSETYRKGHTVGYRSGESQLIDIWDSCTDSTHLYEHRCINGYLSSETWDCGLYGCNDGACSLTNPACTDTCTSLGYSCGPHTICGVSVNCGNCANGYICSYGICIQQVTPVTQITCTDTDSGVDYSKMGKATITSNPVYTGIIYEGQTQNLFGRAVKIEFMDSSIVILNLNGELTSRLSERQSYEDIQENRITINDINYSSKAYGSSSVNFTLSLKSSANDFCYFYSTDNIVENCSGSDCRMIEHYCSSTGIQMKYYQCNTCHNGVCVGPDSNPCTDSDGGLNYYIRGQVVGPIGPGEGSNGLDYCYNGPGTQSNTTTGKYLLEWSCTSSGGADGKTYECPNGCLNGACKTATNTTTYYPSPFVVNGVADVAIIYGTQTGVSSLELVQAGNIQTDLEEHGLLGDALVKDSETASVNTKNWIVVGTPCSNSAIYKSLGLTDCTSVASKLGIGPGQAIFKSIANPQGTGIVFLVVGYTPEILTKAVTYLISKEIRTSIGSSSVITLAELNQTYYADKVCNDSDGGIKYGVKGEVTIPFGTGTRILIDYCENEAILNESYCEGNYANTLTRDCGMEGKICSNGACIEVGTACSVNADCNVGYFCENGVCIKDQQGGPSPYQLSCMNAGGTWKTFSNGCADYCEFARNSANIACTQVITESCDCGINKCWTGKTCEPNNVTKEITCNYGCSLNSKCYPFGYRKTGKYCSEDYQFIEQTKSDTSCENSFECKSNLCLDDQCVSQGVMKKFFNWLKSRGNKGK